MKKKLQGLSDIRRFFHRNETPIYFVSATNFNLLGIDEWVRNFRHINYINCFDGRHPNTFVPGETAHDEFGSIEDIVNYLLQHKEVVDYLRDRGKRRGLGEGDGLGKAVFLIFDEKTEEICNELGLDVWFPAAGLRSRVDNKIETVRIGDRAGVPSVPNQLAPVKSWEDLQAAAQGLGTDLVVQTAFGDSGHTTFFIASGEDYEKHAEEIAAESEVKIMKRLRADQSLEYARFDYHRRAVETENEGFWLRISGKGGYRYEGADLGILITRGRLMTDDFQLNDRAKAFIQGLRNPLHGRFPASTP